MGERDYAVYQRTFPAREHGDFIIAISRVSVGNTRELTRHDHFRRVAAIDGDVDRSIGKSDLRLDSLLRTFEEFGQERPAVHLFDHVDTRLRFVLVDRDLDFRISAVKHAAKIVVAEFSGSQLHPGPRGNDDVERTVAVGCRVVLVVEQE